jgi:hypothetical protein
MNSKIKHALSLNNISYKEENNDSINVNVVKKINSENNIDLGNEKNQFFKNLLSSKN